MPPTADTRQAPAPKPVTAAAPRYDAFVSYSRTADGKLGPALRNSLHSFLRPRFRRAALRVFLDRHSLPAGELWPRIKGALDTSAHLILIASPQAAESSWVEKELKYWIDSGHRRPIYLVLTDGEIIWDVEARDFDWTRTTAVPRCLSGWYEAEQNYVDLRWTRTWQPSAWTPLRRKSFRSDARFYSAVATIASALRGKSKDELISEDHRLQQRALRLAGSGATVLALLLVAALVLGMGWLDQRNTARQQRDHAERQRRAATSRQLATEASLTIEDTPELSMLLSLAAYELSPTPEAAAGLFSQVQRRPWLQGLLSGHRGQIMDVVFSPDGRTLASVGDGAVITWDVTRHKRLTTIETDAWSEVALSPDGSTLAIGHGKTVTLWNASSGQRLTAFPRGLNTLAKDGVAFSPDGQLLAVVSRGHTVMLWDASGERQLATLHGPRGELTMIAFSPDGQTLATATADGNILLWDVAQRRRFAILRGHADGVLHQMVFSPDSRVLATGGDDKQVLLWNVNSGDRLATLIGHTNRVHALAFSSDGRKLVSGSEDTTAMLWDVNEGRRIATLEGHSGPVIAAAFLGDDQTLATADWGSVMLWGAARGERKATSRGHTTSTWVPAAFSPDAGILATGGPGGTVMLWDAALRGHPVTLRSRPNRTGFMHTTAFSPARGVLAVFSETDYSHLPEPSMDVTVWDVARGERLATFPTKDGDPVGISPDGRILATAKDDQTVALWDVERRELLTTLGSDSDQDQVAFSPDGSTLAVRARDDHTVAVWDIARREVRATLTVRTDPDAWLPMAFSYDNRLLATGTRDGSVQVWDIARGERLTALNVPDGGVGAVTFSPDGRTLAATGTRQTILWDLSSHKRLAILTDASTPQILDVEFSPNGRTLVTVGDNALMLWDAARYQRLATLSSGPVRGSVVFSPDSRRLAGATQGDEVWLTGVDVEQRYSQLCTIVSRSLTPEERASYLPDDPQLEICG